MFHEAGGPGLKICILLVLPSKSVMEKPRPCVCYVTVSSGAFDAGESEVPWRVYVWTYIFNHLGQDDECPGS